jgi:hypothetical protein
MPLLTPRLRAWQAADTSVLTVRCCLHSRLPSRQEELIWFGVYNVRDCLAAAHAGKFILCGLSLDAAGPFAAAFLPRCYHYGSYLTGLYRTP